MHYPNSRSAQEINQKITNLFNHNILLLIVNQYECLFETQINASQMYVQYTIELVYVTLTTNVCYKHFINRV